jgi:hypothetical protein
VRVELNEDCWLGINGVQSQYSGANYQSAIVNYVNALNAAGMVAILDLHWNAPGTIQADNQQNMADADHSPAFWTSVATTFKSNPSVVFDLYNEPYNVSWSCWLHGCTDTTVNLATNAKGAIPTKKYTWQVAGMQTLVNAVRATGATQPLMLGGLDQAADLSGWLANEPVDPLHQLVASVHVYQDPLETPTYWNTNIAPVAAQVPVVTGELGEFDCADTFIDPYMAWADQHGVSYLAWDWQAVSAGVSCDDLALVQTYDGPATNYGIGFQEHLAQLAEGGMGTVGP